MAKRVKLAFDKLPVEIMSVGAWNGRDYTSEDLDALVRNFARLRQTVKPMLKFGHDEDQKLIGQEDGDPALGWVSNVYRRGDKVLAEFSDLPAIVQQAIEKKLYARVSCELAVDAELDGEAIGMVLTGVALLGSDLPAVSNLADLQAYLGDAQQAANALDGCRRVRLTYEPGKETDMTAEEKAALEAAGKSIKDIMAKIETLTEKLSKAADGKVDQKVLDDLKAENVKLKEARRVESFATQRGALVAKLDDKIKAKQLLPSTREKIDGLVLGQKERFSEQLMFSGEELLAIIETMKPVNIVDNEQALDGKTSDLVNEQGEQLSLENDPALEVVKRVNEMMMKNPRLGHLQATNLVLQSDAKLAQQYHKSRDGLAQIGAAQLRQATSAR